MGQNRTDTNQQLAAKQRVANRRKCPRCLRKSALSSPVHLDNDWTVRECNYCGHCVGLLDGKAFGYDVEPDVNTTASSRKEQR